MHLLRLTTNSECFPWARQGGALDKDHQSFFFKPSLARQALFIISQIRKLRFREGKRLVYGHTGQRGSPLPPLRAPPAHTCVTDPGRWEILAPVKTGEKGKTTLQLGEAEEES